MAEWPADVDGRVTRRSASVTALVLLGLAYGWFAQGEGAAQNAHYALVRSLAQGTAVVDETRTEIGNVVTRDVVQFEGHYYSNKAPGLAFATLPAYVALERAGVRTTGDPTRMLWALGLVGTVLPALLLTVLVGRAAEKLEPGYGTATGIALGAGTLLLPYATVFFAHALSAFLSFAAFSLVWADRERRSGYGRVACAGVLAGLAVTTEYPTAIVALVLGLVVLLRTPRLRRVLAYGAGLLVGVSPLLVYNEWAFRSPTRLSYGAGDVLSPATTPGAGKSRFFGVGVPDFTVAVELLFSFWGLLVVTPVVAAGAVATILMFRRGRRTEALVVAAVALLFLAYNSGFWGYGGTAGARYLIPMLPFLAYPIALAFRAAPVATGALAAASTALMVAMTATHPLSAWDGGVLRRLRSSDGSAQTVSDFVGITGWYDVVPFYVFMLGALVCAALATPLPITRAGIVNAVVALAAWAVVAVTAPQLLNRGWVSREAAAITVLALVAAVAGVLFAAMRVLPRHAVE
jgi:hypothetical protein